MPTYLLDGDSEARISAAPLSVILGTTGNQAAFLLEAASDSELPVITPKPGMLVLPRISGRTALRVRPVGAQAFPEGSVVSLTITLNNQSDPDPERIVVSQVDVSGLSHRDLVILEPLDGFISARSSLARFDTALGDLALQARVATRELLGVEHVDATSAINVVVAIDASASMLGLTRDGFVSAIVDVLVGVSQVVSPGRDVSAAIVTSSVRWIESASASGLSAAVRAAQEETPLTTGFRSAHPGLIGRAPDQNTVTYIVTDGVPADYAALEVADTIDGEARHLVVLGDATSTALAHTPNVNVTTFDTARLAGVDTADALDARTLRTLVTALLQGCFVPGTPYAKKVAS